VVRKYHGGPSRARRPSDGLPPRVRRRRARRQAGGAVRVPAGRRRRATSAILSRRSTSHTSCSPKVTPARNNGEVASDLAAPPDRRRLWNV